MPFEKTADRYRDRARLFRDDHHDGVGILAHADACTVSHAEVAAEIDIFGKREHAASSE